MMTESRPRERRPTWAGPPDQEDGVSSYHVPVLVQEVLDFLRPAGTGVILDGTVGGGGHTRAILDACPACRVVAFDRDPEALEEARAALRDVSSRVELHLGEYGTAVEVARLDDGSLQGALLDLGVSSRQLDDPERGFAFRHGLSLDMRMAGPAGDASSAADILNEAPEGELYRIFREYGEVPQARSLAREIARRRSRRSFDTSDDLVAALTSVLGRPAGAQEKARAFMALRIEVNRELDQLALGLPRIRDALAPGGTFVVLSYHSLEDRLVKNSFREWSQACVCPPGLPLCTCRGVPLGTVLTRKPVRPNPAEAGVNPRARSARLRAWRKAA